MEKKISSHGGKRTGAGRPKKEYKTLSITIESSLIPYIESVKNKSQFIGTCIKEYISNNQ